MDWYSIATNYVTLGGKNMKERPSTYRKNVETVPPLIERQGKEPPLVDFKFFRNTPFNDFQNTIHFSSNAERDKFFLEENHYTTIDIREPFNFVNQRGHLKIGLDYNSCYGLNYCTWQERRFNLRMYAFVVGVNYLNDNTTELILVVDSVMTFCQGNFHQLIGEVEVQREHLSKSEYRSYLPMIRTNSDILEANTKRYVFNKADIFKEFWVLFECSADLSGDWGDAKDPKLPVSEGVTYDRITSPINLYVLQLEDFHKLTTGLKPFPWIAQCMKSVIMLPTQFIDKNDLQPVLISSADINNVFTFKNGTVTSRQNFGTHYTMNQLANFCGIDYNEEPHLLRTGYTTMEVFSWDGQAVYIDPAFLDEATGYQMDCISSIGHFNQIALYPMNYKTSPSESDDNGVNKGQFLNNAIIYNTFNELPVYIDSPKLAQAQNAHQRELSESKLLSKRFDNATTGSSGNKQQQLMDAISLTTDIGGAFLGGGAVGGASKLLGMYTDEYEFYRSQKAQFADMALMPPTINGQANGTAFQISTNTYGVTLKMSAPEQVELDKIRRYYNTFGFEMNVRKQLSDVSSMSMMNYVQFSGNWHLPNVPVELMEQLKAQFLNGIKLWHNDGSSNPFTGNLLLNKKVK